jgi:hypothetical protein
MVAMLTTDMVSAMGWDDKSCCDAVMYALYHDVAEVLTGDVPSPMKKIMGEPFAEIEEEIMGNYNRWIATGRIKAVVKLADLAEAVKFLQQHKASSHADSVYQMVRRQLTEFEKKVKEDWPNEYWDPALDVINDFLYGTEYSIDSYFEDKGYGQT